MHSEVSFRQDSCTPFLYKQQLYLQYILHPDAKLPRALQRRKRRVPCVNHLLRAVVLTLWESRWQYRRRPLIIDLIMIINVDVWERLALWPVSSSSGPGGIP